MEVQQSPLYINYIESLGWHHVKVDGVYIVYKHFPLLGGLAKMQRPAKLVALSTLIPLLKNLRIHRIAIEPDSLVSQQEFSVWYPELGRHFKRIATPFLPTKTIRIDLTANEDVIFQRFTEAKRRAVRRAVKNKVVIKEANNIDDLIKIKNKSAGLFGFITTYGIKKLWQIFAPGHAAILLAYSSTYNLQPTTYNLIGGVLLLFMDKIAYYWIAGATRKGKKLFAPTFLVWEALKLSKKRGCRSFDFVGVWDERSPRQYHEWKGFTKFKEGFNGQPLFYPISK